MEAIFSYRWPKVEGVVESSIVKVLKKRTDEDYRDDSSYRPLIPYIISS